MIQYKKLGSSSLSISPIGFGCMSLEKDQQKTTELIHRAIECGINYFDTADLYDKGLNEEMVGKALQGKRTQVVLATKVGNEWKQDGSGWDWNPRKKYILKAVEKSLTRLQTDYIDLYQLHGGTLEDPIDEVIETFELLKQQGKIKYYGISSIRPAVIKEWINRSNLVSVMMQYSLLDRRPEEECLSLLQQNNIGVLARGSLAKGLLAGKPATEFLDHQAHQVEEAAIAIRNVSGIGRSPSQTAIQFTLHQPAITSAVIGIRTLEQLEDAVATLSTPALTAQEWKQLSDAVPAKNY